MAMRYVLLSLLLISPLLISPALAQLPPASARRVDFRSDIEPILRAHCLGCHGPAAQQSGFRLDDRASLLKGGYSGKVAIVPGDSAASPLILRVAGQPGMIAMPPAGQRLSPEQIGVLRAWIDQGAAWSEAPTTSSA